MTFSVSNLDKEDNGPTVPYLFDAKVLIRICHFCTIKTIDMQFSTQCTLALTVSCCNMDSVLHPDSGWTFSALAGEAYVRLQKLPEAEHWYKESLRAKPDHIPAHLTYGKLLAMTVRLPLNNSEIVSVKTKFSSF